MPGDLSELPYLIVGIGVAMQEEMTSVAERLIEKGKSLTPEGRKSMAAARRGLSPKGGDFSRVVAETVQHALENAGIVTKDDLEKLNRRVDEIERKLTPGSKRAGGKAAAKRARPKKAAAEKASGKPAGKPAGKRPAGGKKTAGKASGAAGVKPRERRRAEAELEAATRPAVEPLRELIRPEE